METVEIPNIPKQCEKSKSPSSRLLVTLQILPHAALFSRGWAAAARTSDLPGAGGAVQAGFTGGPVPSEQSTKPRLDQVPEKGMHLHMSIRNVTQFCSRRVILSFTWLPSWTVHPSSPTWQAFLYSSYRGRVRMCVSCPVPFCFPF